jgi:ABC-type phosphate/phosphonate transport system substrate-binding protein
MLACSMSAFVAALPMYDWPEVRAEVDGEWAAIRERLRAAGIDAPERLARRNGDLPPVPGGIRDRDGMVIAPDPATLPPDELDLVTLWQHPALLLSQTCWGPMNATGLAEHVVVVGQPDYSGVEGGEGALYSSAIVMRREGERLAVPVPREGGAALPPDVGLLRLAINDRDSMSGWLGLREDAAAAGIPLHRTLVSGSHRASVRAVAAGEADLAAIDCRSWVLAKRHEPATRELVVVGWTKRRPGLPFICAAELKDEAVAALETLLGGASFEARFARTSG